MKNIYAYIFIISLACIALLSSCSNNEDGKPGYEFMPDMYRSPSLEIYSSNTFFKDSLNARPPVEGTMPRGFFALEYDNTLEDYILSQFPKLFEEHQHHFLKSIAAKTHSKVFYMP